MSLPVFDSRNDPRRQRRQNGEAKATNYQLGTLRAMGVEFAEPLTYRAAQILINVEGPKHPKPAPSRERYIILQGPQEPTADDKANRLKAIYAKMPYREYLQTERWQKVRKAAYARAEHRCQICYSTGKLSAHHRTYQRLGNEKDGDLTVLCDRCHKLFHQLIPAPPI